MTSILTIFISTYAYLSDIPTSLLSLNESLISSSFFCLANVSAKLSQNYATLTTDYIRLIKSLTWAPKLEKSITPAVKSG